VGVADEDHVLAERSLPISGSHATSLLGLVQQVFAQAGISVSDLDAIAISRGPGSFTGLRIGMSVAKGLALATGAPVVGVCTLKGLAVAARPRLGFVCAALDARKGEIYAATYRWHDSEIECVRPPEVLSPQSLIDTIPAPCLVVGDAVDVYGRQPRWQDRGGVEVAPFLVVSPSGGIVARLGAARLHAAGPDDVVGMEPTYVRPPEAEIARDDRGVPGGSA
jgi:tRNA threonylcarbamoyladenosine biosynthesis protein TsaB